MKTRHDDHCLWWKDWHSCSCGFLEEEVRKENKHETEDCLIIIPNTFAVCGEDYGGRRQYCSKRCWEKNINN